MRRESGLSRVQPPRSILDVSLNPVLCKNVTRTPYLAYQFVRRDVGLRCLDVELLDNDVFPACDGRTSRLIAPRVIPDRPVR